MKRGLTILVLSLVVFAGWRWISAGNASATGRRADTNRIRFYQDAMHPWVRSDRAGTCSLCGMALIPVVQAEDRPPQPAALVKLSPDAVTVANVATALVRRRDIQRALRVSGFFEAQESRTAMVVAPAGGRIEFVAADFPGKRVSGGETVVRLFSPDLAQRSRFLRVSMSNQPAAWMPASAGAASARREAPLTSDGPLPAVGGYRMDAFMCDLVAPMAGIVSERPVTLGQYVMEGQKMATIIDPSVLWFRFEVSDRQLQWVLPGQSIEMRLESTPAQTWPGTITLIEPVLSEHRGFASVRAIVTNMPAPPFGPLGSAASLRPGMFADGRIGVVLSNVLAVPKSAIIYPGSSAWVYVERQTRSYERRPIQLGREGDDGWEILAGLREGERVVTTGNVLIDAQATLEHGDASAPLDDPPKLAGGFGPAVGVNRSGDDGAVSDPYCSVRPGWSETSTKRD